MVARRFSVARFFPALMIFALVVLALAAAPVLAARAEGHFPDMAMTAPTVGADGACTEMAGKGSSGRGGHAGKCLAACLAAHGAPLPHMPVPEAAWQRLPAIADTSPVHKLANHSVGLDPPPPRYA